ncbi:EAL domain-containing protein [Noviherbaspirillum sp. ST9]|uniref:EAL domain-containing protein n=1 Tax=Noviherbaspirillum sp. ST9 TaxID=3401606 RepID=UPI003B589518
MNTALPDRVLYLEDNPMDADLVRRALARQAPHMSLDIAPSLVEAMRLVAPDMPPYDLILSDLRLPDGSGMELLAHVRERRLPIAVVILTGSGDQASAIAALKAGADDYVVKRAEYHVRLLPTMKAALARFRSEFNRKARILRVLYAEHNTFDIDLTRRHLARYAPHIRLNVVKSGEDVLMALPRATARALPFDVLLLDYQLPEVNALEVVKILRDERGLDLPVVMVTGQGSEDVVAEALRIGVADYLVKHAGYLSEMPAVLEHAHRQAQLEREQEKLRTTADRLRQMLEANPTILYVLHLDGERMAPQWISENVTRVYGYTVEESLQPGWWWSGVHADDREWVMAERQRLFNEHRLTQEYRFHDKSGAVCWVRDEMRLLSDATGKPVSVVGSWSDVTEDHRASERQQLQAAALASTRDAVMITDLESRIIYVNPAFTEITGYTEAEIVGRNPRILHSGQHEPEFYEAMWERLRERGQWQGEVWNRRKNADVYPEWLTISAVRDASGKPTHFVAVMTDLTVIKRSEEQLDHLAHYDPLTNLPNRALLRSLLQHAVEKAQRRREQVGVLFLNLDKFKTINDSLGHVAGDQLLMSVTARLTERLAGRQLLGRLSADEFVVVVESLLGAEDAESIAFDLRNAIEAPFLVDGNQEVYVRTSIGVSLFPQDGLSAHALLQHADAAVHRAKERGGNQIAFYTAELSMRALAQLQMEAGLRRALRHHKFVLYFQPKVDLASGRITGAEALLRLPRSNQEIVYPSEFIPLAEKSGQIVAIGAWIIDEACRHLRTWNDAGYTDITVAVNVSARQFRSEDLEAVVESALARHGVPAHQLTLELTESMLVDSPEQTIDRLRRMKRSGLQLALDDFGTGYSSLGYLSRLPMDQLKIDKSFVVDIVNDRNAANIASSVIDLAHRMQLRVVAEGVETEEQLAYLDQNHCDEIQGYYFSRPVPAEEFTRQLQNNKTLKTMRRH